MVHIWSCILRVQQQFSPCKSASKRRKLLEKSPYRIKLINNALHLLHKKHFYRHLFPHKVMATLHSQCCENPPTLDPVYGKGHVVDDLGGLKTYVTGSPESKLAILLISDAFGFEAPLLRNLADKVAASGFYVVVPDFFHGDPLTPEIFETETSRDQWISKHKMEQGFEEARPVIETLKKKGFSAIGAAGFCWGGKVVVMLAKYDYINAAVSLHPGPLTHDDIRDVKQPIAILGAEIDQWSPPEVVKEFAEILSLKPEVDSHVKIFPGVVHGWAVRYDVNDKTAVEKAEEAQKDMLDWLVKYVK